MTVDRLPEYTFVEGRITFPQSALPEATQLSQQKLQEILDEEGRWADEANAEEHVLAPVLGGEAVGPHQHILAHHPEGPGLPFHLNGPLDGRQRARGRPVGR